MDLKSYNSLNTSCRCSEMHHQWCTVSWGHRVFQDFWNIRHPRRGDPAGGDQFLGCILARDDDGASLFSQSHLVALSAASVTDLITLFLAKPTIPSLARIHLYRLTVGDPALPPALLHQLLVLGILRSCALSMHSFQGMVSLDGGLLKSL